MFCILIGSVLLRDGWKVTTLPADGDAPSLVCGGVFSVRHHSSPPMRSGTLSKLGFLTGSFKGLEEFLFSFLPLPSKELDRAAGGFPFALPKEFCTIHW